MTRGECMKLLATAEIKNMCISERDLIIQNAWGLDETDEIFSLLSIELCKEMLAFDEPQHDTSNELYTDLLFFTIVDSYKFLTNDKLSKLVSKIVKKNILVEGKEPKLFTCPCCGYKTLTTRGEYEICSICLWEDSGTDQDNVYSGPNHMTLKEAKNNYLTYGTVDGISATKIIDNGKDE